MTGGNGLLGNELKKHLIMDMPTHKELDILNPYIKKHYDMIIHAAAYTDVPMAEMEKETCFMTNVIGTMNMAKLFTCSPFVYISSEYAYNPINYYSQTKLCGEVVVKAMCEKYLIIRTLFKPNPFPWPKAFINQYTMGDYVDVIAKLIAKEIKKWDKKTSKTLYIGTGRKTMFELAIRTNRNIEPIYVEDITNVVLPKDYL